MEFRIDFFLFSWMNPVINPCAKLLLRVLNNLKNTFVALDEPLPLRTLATLRGAFPELSGEGPEHARWLRFWN